MENKKLVFEIIEGPLVEIAGQREQQHYGKWSKKELIEKIKNFFPEEKYEITFFSSYSEGEIAKHISTCKNVDGLAVNVGGYTHTSVVIRDALIFSKIPFIEFHFSNIFKRDDFRKKSIISDIASGVIVGCGKSSCFLALKALDLMISDKTGQLT